MHSMHVCVCVCVCVRVCARACMHVLCVLHSSCISVGTDCTYLNCSIVSFAKAS